MRRTARVAFLTTALIGAASVALAYSGKTQSMARAYTRGLIQMMDRDRNGRVSKDEFLQFIGAEFDRLDTDRSGELTHEELRRSKIFGAGAGMHPNPHR